MAKVKPYQSLLKLSLIDPAILCHTSFGGLAGKIHRKDSVIAHGRKVNQQLTDALQAASAPCRKA